MVPFPSITTSHNGKLTEVQIGDVTIWFSYATPVAFSTPQIGLVVRENVWGPTTGRHLNAIDGGEKAVHARKDADSFRVLWAEAMHAIGLDSSRPLGATLADRATVLLEGQAVPLAEAQRFHHHVTRVLAGA